MMPENRRNAAVITVLAVGVALAGCDSGPTEPAPDDANLVMAVIGTSMSMRPVPSEPDQPFEQACPAGGRLVVEGTSTVEREGDLSVHVWDQLMRHQDCGLEVSSGVVIAEGEMHVFGEARFGPPVDQRSPLLMQESRQVGSMTTEHDGRTRTCAYDLSHSFEPDANRYRITGTACGRTVDLRAPLP